jgi:hypothetical protein
VPLNKLPQSLSYLQPCCKFEAVNAKLYGHNHSQHLIRNFRMGPINESVTLHSRTNTLAYCIAVTIFTYGRKFMSVKAVNFSELRLSKGLPRTNTLAYCIAVTSFINGRRFTAVKAVNFSELP